jgi:hypothetical protein
MSLPSQTFAILAAPFEGGNGPTRSVIELIWIGADAGEYLGEGNKMTTVLNGLHALKSGRDDNGNMPALPPDEEKLREVVANLATRLMAERLVDKAQLFNALERDGFAVTDGKVDSERNIDEPVDRLGQYVEKLFSQSPEFEVAKRHYRQATRAYEREDWEAANAQYRSSFDATFDALAVERGAPAGRTGGAARKWLQGHGILEKDAAELIRAFASYAGGAGSHAGISPAADAGLRRHFATALIAFAMAKYDEPNGS